MRSPACVGREGRDREQPTTSTTPTFMGLDRPGTGSGAKLGGVGKAGENVIIGVVDTGIWPEHPSFCDRTGLIVRTGEGAEARLSAALRGWHGKCHAGRGFNASDCNQKLIGAQLLTSSGFGASRTSPSATSSRRATTTATAATRRRTAGGNNGIQATGDAAPFGKISGMAPRARIAAYKVCWRTPATAAAPAPTASPRSTRPSPTAWT